MEQQTNSGRARFPLLGWVVVLALLTCQVVVCFLGRGPALAGKIDLRAFYAAGTIVRSGHGAQLYDYDYQDQIQNAVVGPRAGALPFLYPSFAALPFVPLSLFSYRSAFVVLLGVNLALLLLVAFLLRPWLSFIRNLSWWLLPSWFGCLFGVSVALMQGQLSFALLAIYCGTWILLQRDRPMLAGALMSLALVKFQIAIPIVFLFFIWKRWRFVAGFSAGAVALAGLSAALVGKAGTLAYWNSMSGMTRQTALHADVVRSRYGMSLNEMPNLHGLTYGMAHTAAWGLILNIVLCVAALTFAARQKPSLLVALPAAMLVSYHMQPHDLTLLLLPLSFELNELFQWFQRNHGGMRHALRTYKAALAPSLLLLVLPVAGVLTVEHINYVAALAVVGVMFAASGLPLHRYTSSSTATLS